MNDDDLERNLGLALRERFPVPSDVELFRLERPAAASPRNRIVLAVAACVAAVAALSIALALRSNDADRASAAGPLTGVTWQGSEPVLTLVFTDHTVRIFDGCSNELRQVSIGHGVLDIGKPIGQGSGCTGTPGGPPPDIANFDNVMSSHHLTWHRSRDTLRLANAHGQSVELHVVGAALGVTDQEWSLERFIGPHGYDHEGNYRAARLLISNGTVHASDLCNDLSGSAAVTDTIIAFIDMRATDRACVDQALTTVADLIDHVLSGTTDYTIRGNELIINGHAHGLLIYIPSR